MVTVIQYQFPREAYQIFLALTAFLYVDQAQPNTIGARIRDAVGGPSVLDKIRQLTVAIHILEALVMLFVNVRRGSSLGVTVCVYLRSLTCQLKWVVTTFVLGGPSWGTFSSAYFIADLRNQQRHFLI